MPIHENEPRDTHDEDNDDPVTLIARATLLLNELRMIDPLVAHQVQALWGALAPHCGVERMHDYRAELYAYIRQIFQEEEWYQQEENEDDSG